MSTNMTMRPIGTMRSLFHFKNGTPRQSSLCENARGILTIEKSIFNNPEHSLEGLDEYSHAWVIFVFHKNNNAHTKAKVKPPRLDGQRVGVFSSRSPYRPNNIGLSLVKIDKVEGASVHLSGIDILDGTPVLDIKPYIPEYDKPSRDVNDTHRVSQDCKDSENISDISSGNDPSDISADRVQAHPNHCSRADGRAEAGVIHNDRSGAHPEKLPKDAAENTIVDRVSSLNQDRNREDVTLVKAHNEDALLHPAAEGFYELSAALEKAGQTLGSAANQNKSNSTDNSAEAATKMCSDLCSILTSEVEDDEDDIDMLVGNIISKAAVEISGEDSSLDVTERTSSKSHSAGKTSSRSNCTKSGEGHKTSAVIAPWLLKPPVSKLNVGFTSQAHEQLKNFSMNSTNPHYRLEMLSNSEEAERAIVDILREEPRSVYRRQHCQDSLYYFVVDVLHITCWFDEDTAQVVRVKPTALVPKLQCKDGTNNLS